MQITRKKIMKAILDRFDALLNFGVIIGVAVMIAVCGFAFGQIVADKTTPRTICSKCGQSVNAAHK